MREREDQARSAWWVRVVRWPRPSPASLRSAPSPATREREMRCGFSHGVERMTYLDKASLRVVGTRPIRPDGVDKVIGRATFGADMTMPGMLWGRVKRSPHAHARIKSINTDKAAALTPGRAAALSVLIDLLRAWACGLRLTLPHSMPIKSIKTDKAAA